MIPLARRLRDAFPHWVPPAGRPPRPRRAEAPETASAPCRTVRPPFPGSWIARMGRSRRIRPRGRGAATSAWTAAWLAAGLLAEAFGTSAPARAADLLREAVVADRAFHVTIEARNEGARQSRAADLYVARRPGAPWMRVGECEPVYRDGKLFFERGLQAPADGVYYFTSSPVGENLGRVRPPPAGEPPQARVLVDTLAPVVEWLAPEYAFRVSPGQILTLRWRVHDENLAEFPAALSISLNDGGPWRLMAPALSAAGQQDFFVPADWPAGPVVLRIEARDLAGNVGMDWVEGELLPAPPPEPIHPPAASALPARAPEPVHDEPGNPEAAADASPAPGAEAVFPDPTESPRRAASPEEPAPRLRHAWAAYLAACNEVRRDRPKDALRFFREAVDADPDLLPAWADFALAYKEIGAFGPARRTLDEALRLAPADPALLRLRGEIEHADGMSRLAAALDRDQRQAAREKIDLAVRHYAASLDAAAKSQRLAEQAPTYYRLGEICYHVNHDPAGARAYWRKILDLHASAPDPEPVRRARNEQERRLETKRFERRSLLAADLSDWQTWARQLVLELDERERRGIVTAAPQSSDPRRGRGDALADAPLAGADAGGPPAAQLLLPDDVPGPGSSGTLASRGLTGSGSPLAEPGLAYGREAMDPFARMPSPRGEAKTPARRGGGVPRNDPASGEADGFSSEPAFSRLDGAREPYYPVALIPPDPPRRDWQTANPSTASWPAEPARLDAAARSADWPGFAPSAKTPAWTAADYGSRP